MKFTLKLIVSVLLIMSPDIVNAQIIIDHRHTDIIAVPTNWIAVAKQNLHIAYGHTSHGSQVISGMGGLVSFANGGGKGLSVPNDFFDWNNGGSGGTLDLHDYAMGGDVGYFPQWVNNTTNYLDNPANSDVNVVMWSWCGQVETKYNAGTLTNDFLAPMSALEVKYPDVMFVYMTGHVDTDEDTANKAANNLIRQYCSENGKVLYDFADIDRYDPDGTYFEFVNDTCDYYDYIGSPIQGNWAREWEQSHVEDVDWFDCSSAHSEALNANQKAYAAWALFARLAGWSGPNFYDCWVTKYFSKAEYSAGVICGQNDDPDGDGVMNCFEHAFALNPREKDEVCINSMSFYSNKFELTYRRNKYVPGIDMNILTYTNLLSSPTEIPLSECNSSVSNNLDDTETVLISFVDNTASNIFYRLNAETNF